jgi:hypothetical protein
MNEVWKIKRSIRKKKKTPPNGNRHIPFFSFTLLILLLRNHPQRALSSTRGEMLGIGVANCGRYGGGDTADDVVYIEDHRILTMLWVKRKIKDSDEDEAACPTAVCG